MMRRIIVMMLVIACSATLKAQDQTVPGDLYIGSGEHNQLGFSNRIFFLGNTDNIWMSQFNTGFNQSEFRINISDDTQAEDKFVVGVTSAANGQWYPRLTVQGDGYVGINTTTPEQMLTVKGGGIGFDWNSADKKLYSPSDGDLEWFTHSGALSHGFAVSHQGQKKVYLNTSGYSYFTGGNVGIGTNTPEATLTVYHDVALGSTPRNSSLIARFSGLGGSAGNNYQNNIWMVRNASGNSWTTASLHDGLSIDGSFQNPQVDTKTWWERDPLNDIQSWGTAANAYMTISQGNIGIGTVSPETKFEVQNNVSGWAMNLRTQAYTQGEMNGIKIFSGDLSERNKWVGIASIAEDYASNHTGLSLYAGQAERLRVSSDGKVGIGTPIPAAQLHVVGGGALVSNYLGYTLDSGTGQIGHLSATGSAITMEAYGAATRFRVVTNGDERLTILPTGNVGIGTNDPKGYKLAVAGSAVAESMTVKLQGNWPDYVFKKDYQLPTLPELQDYIQVNHHLPEMPSEKEVSANGLNLGEINKLLTKKVEELTLYLIEKDKVQKVLEEKVRNLEGQEDKIKKLEAQMARLLTDQ